jgi:putative DNA primase/helicase
VSALDVARGYLGRGWRVIPVPFRSKRPTIAGWPGLRLDASDLDRHFNGQPVNIGTLLGEPSGGLTDVDLDCPEALRLASRFLPLTHSTFGRASKPRSHWLYYADPIAPTEKYEDLDGAMLVELRSTGVQTVFPGSVHPSGEAVEWDKDGEVARGPGATLRQAVAQLGAACLLARHWPATGSRHAAALAAAGLLVRGGLDEARCVLIVQAAAEAAGDEEVNDRRLDVMTTAAKIAAGEAVTGGPTLTELLRGDGVKLVALLRRWLGLQGIGSGSEHLTDTGNAARFVAAQRDHVRYVYPWGAWLEYDGARWRRDPGDAVIRRAKETARAIYSEAAHATDETQRKQLAKWATYSESEPGIRRMLTLAQAELAITPGQLNVDPWLLNCLNGTLELRTGHLRPHQRADFLTKMTAAPYDPDARAPIWDTFLETSVPDEGARDFAQRYAGYCLTGVTREEVFVFCRGPAGGGKSTFTEGLRRTWGDYASSADFGTFLTKRPSDGPREDIARLAGARLVTSVETREGQHLAEGLVKLLTGGDTVSARRLYERTFEFVPQFKLLFASNYRPGVRADDDAIWRRLRELPFPTARTNREQRDDSVKATIVDPAQMGPAILAWAVEGCGRWLAEGLGEPDAVMRATADYRKSQEPLADFLAECCVLGAGYSVPAESLRAEYELWCRTEGVQGPVGGRRWGAALRAAGCTNRKAPGGARWWDGIALKSGSREPGEDDPPW